MVVGRELCGVDVLIVAARFGAVPIGALFGSRQISQRLAPISATCSPRSRLASEPESIRYSIGCVMQIGGSRVADCCRSNLVTCDGGLRNRRSRGSAVGCLQCNES